MSEWQPIDTAPKDGTEVWVSGFKGNVPDLGRWVAPAFYREEHWIDIGDDMELYPPTHWMEKLPTPEPPK